MKCRLFAGITVAVMSLLIARPHTASAEQLYLVRGSGMGEMSVEQLLLSYEGHSTAGRQIRNALYLVSLEERSARMSKVSAEETSARLQSAIEQLAWQKEQSAETEAQMDALEEQIEQLELQKQEQELAILGAKLGWKQKTFYTENRTTLFDIRMNRKNYVVLSKALNLALLEKQQEYYACCEELLEVKKTVAEVRERYGIATETEKKELLTEEKELAGYVMSAKETADATVNELIRETSLGNSSLLLSYKKEWKGYDTRSVVSRFLKNTEAYLQVEHYMQMYREYEHDLPQEEAEAKEQAKALVENYEIQEEISRKQLEAYAEEMLAAYGEAQRKFDAAEANLSVCEKRYYAECKKQEYGMATKQSVLECKAELLNAEAEYLQCVVEKVRLEFILEHGIYVDAQM